MQHIKLISTQRYCVELCSVGDSRDGIRAPQHNTNLLAQDIHCLQLIFGAWKLYTLLDWQQVLQCHWRVSL